MMVDGLLELPWWGYIAVILSMTHVTIIAVTVYLHRCQAHRALELHPLVSHFFRFWLWLTTGMVTREWVAVHRKHHAKTETHEDPHSPHIEGIQTVLWQGAELYRAESSQPDTLADYGHGTPNDWIERNLYARYPVLGVSLLAVIDFVLFGFIGVTIWAVQMGWIPFFAAGVINGLGHYWGYRNFEVTDGSTNLNNIGVLIGGEEMHNNHHAYPSSAKFSSKAWEFDIGWLYIRLMSLVKMARVKKVAPRPILVAGKSRIDMDTVRAVIASRLHVMAHYARNVTLPVFRAELARADNSYRRMLKKIRKPLLRDENRVDANKRDQLARTLEDNEALQTVYEYRRRLQALWSRTHTSHENLLLALAEWCQQAEATGLEVLQEFAQRLRSYSLQSA